MEIQYDTEYLKQTLFDLFDRFEEYENIINNLRSLNSLGEINDDEYGIILENYDKWLKEYENKGVEE